MNRMASMACAAIAVVAACKGRTSGPEWLRVTEDVSDHVALRWHPPSSGDFDGYVLEWRAGSGAFVPLATFAASNTTGDTTLGPEIPDAVDVEFRLRATPDPDATRSAIAVLHRGPRPPTVSCKWGLETCRAERDGVHLYLGGRTDGATAFTIRSWRHPSGLSTDAVARDPVILPADTTEYVDRFAEGWREGDSYAYRATATKNGRESTVGEGRSTGRVPRVPPANVTAVAGSAGALVSFENRSPGAPCIRIDRQAAGSDRVVVASCLAPPPQGGTAEFLDPGALAYASPLLYVVSATGFGSGLVAQEPLPSAAWTGPPPPAGLGSRLVSLPIASTAVRLGSGAFATAWAGYMNGEFATWHYWDAEVHVQGPLGVEPIPPIPSFSPEGALIAAGADDTVHALVVGSAPPGTATSPHPHHATYEAGAWDVEDVPIASSYVLSLDVGLDGVMRSAWQTAWTDLTIATRGPSGWELDALTGALPSTLGAREFSMAVDSEGVVHAVHRDAAGWLVHRYRSPAGWVSEPVPAVQPPATLLATPGGLVLVASARYGATAVLERSAAGWSTVETLPGEWIASRSADGSAYVLASDTSVRVHDATGVRALERPASGAPWMAVGVRPGGRAWLLEFLLTDPPNREVTALLYEEP